MSRDSRRGSPEHGSRGRVVPLADAHTDVEVLLPWYAAGRLGDDERAGVERHLAGCARCRAELDAERELQALHRELATPADADRGWAAMRERLRASPRDAAVPSGRRWPAIAPALRWLLAGQFAAIGVLATLLVVGAPAERYRGLGADVPAAGASVIAKFRPDAREHELRRALGAAGARVVDGPTASDAYLLQVPAAGLAPALDALRADPAVLLAEALEPGAAR